MTFVRCYPLASRLTYPYVRSSRLLLFPGKMLHFVLPGMPLDPLTPRVTLMINFWGTRCTYGAPRVQRHPHGVCDAVDPRRTPWRDAFPLVEASGTATQRTELEAPIITPAWTPMEVDRRFSYKALFDQEALRKHWFA